MTFATKKMKIPLGIMVMQDFKFFRWPGPFTEIQDLEFDAEIHGQQVVCSADGYGKHSGADSYGNGAFYFNLPDEMNR